MADNGDLDPLVDATVIDVDDVSVGFQRFGDEVIPRDQERTCERRGDDIE